MTHTHYTNKTTETRMHTIPLNLTKQQNFGLVQNKSICRQQNKCDSKTEICFGKGRKHCEKRRKCWLPAFFQFPIMFSKGYFLRVVKSRDWVVKSLSLPNDKI